MPFAPRLPFTPAARFKRWMASVPAKVGTDRTPPVRCNVKATLFSENGSSDTLTGKGAPTTTLKLPLFWTVISGNTASTALRYIRRAPERIKPLFSIRALMEFAPPCCDSTVNCPVLKGLTVTTPFSEIVPSRPKVIDPLAWFAGTPPSAPPPNCPACAVRVRPSCVRRMLAPALTLVIGRPDKARPPPRVPVSSNDPSRLMRSNAPAGEIGIERWKPWSGKITTLRFGLSWNSIVASVSPLVP